MRLQYVCESSDMSLQQCRQVQRSLGKASREHRQAGNLDVAANLVQQINQIQASIRREEEVTVYKKVGSFHEAVLSLTDREKQVLRLRLTECMTLEQAGRELHVTRERIRQIEAKAFRKLRGWI